MSNWSSQVVHTTARILDGVHPDVSTQERMLKSQQTWLDEDFQHALQSIEQNMVLSIDEFHSFRWMLHRKNQAWHVLEDKKGLVYFTTWLIRREVYDLYWSLRPLRTDRAFMLTIYFPHSHESNKRTITYWILKFVWKHLTHSDFHAFQLDLLAYDADFSKATERMD